MSHLLYTPSYQNGDPIVELIVFPKRKKTSSTKIIYYRDAEAELLEDIKLGYEIAYKAFRKIDYREVLNKRDYGPRYIAKNRLVECTKPDPSDGEALFNFRTALGTLLSEYNIGCVSCRDCYICRECSLCVACSWCIDCFKCAACHECIGSSRRTNVLKNVAQQMKLKL